MTNPIDTTTPITDVIDMLVPQALTLMHVAGGSLLFGQKRALLLNEPEDLMYRREQLEQAEQATGAYLLRELHKLRPQDTVVIDYKDHEETHPGQPATRHLTWYVKPLDGVQNFEHGFGSYAITLSAMDETRGRLRFAAVHNPSTEHTWWADNGKAYRQQGRRGRAEQFGPYTLSNLTVVATNYPRDRDLRHAYMRKLPQITDQFQHLRMLGSGALQGVFVAEARMNALLEFDVKPSSYLPSRELIRICDGLSDLVTLADGSTALVAARQAKDFDLLIKSIREL